MEAAPRMPVELYVRVRAWMIANDPDAQPIIDWAEGLAKPRAFTGDDLAGEIIWIILCAGRSAQAARTIERRVWEAIRAGRPVVEAFGYRAKADAIEAAWRDRSRLLDECRDVLASGDLARLVEWCGKLRFVGDDTKWQLAKNLGADVCKPDIWLCRLAGFPDKPRQPERIRFPACMDLCQPLAAATGDRIATVDSVLWLACNKGVLDPTSEGVRFRPKTITARPILAETPTLFDGKDG
jgi:hypothetical protein